MWKTFTSRTGTAFDEIRKPTSCLDPVSLWMSSASRCESMYTAQTDDMASVLADHPPQNPFEPVHYLVLLY
jgi:hypothetical protein